MAPLHEEAHCQTQAEQEEKERLRKERAEAHKYTYVRVATDADMQAQIGSARQFDLVDHDKVCPQHVLLLGGWMLLLMYVVIVGCSHLDGRLVPG